MFEHERKWSLPDVRPVAISRSVLMREISGERFAVMAEAQWDSAGAASDELEGQFDNRRSRTTTPRRNWAIRAGSSPSAPPARSLDEPTLRDGCRLRPEPSEPTVTGRRRIPDGTTAAPFLRLDSSRCSGRARPLRPQSTSGVDDTKVDLNRHGVEPPSGSLKASTRAASTPPWSARCSRPSGSPLHRSGWRPGEKDGDRSPAAEHEQRA